MSGTATEDAPIMGGNTEAELKRRIERRIDLAEQAKLMTVKLKDWKAEDKNDGFDEDGISDAVKMRMAEPERVLKTLTKEATRTVYRKVAGVPVEIAAAAEIARQHAETIPDVEEKRKRRARVDLDDNEEDA